VAITAQRGEAVSRTVKLICKYARDVSSAETVDLQAAAGSIPVSNSTPSRNDLPLDLIRPTAVISAKERRGIEKQAEPEKMVCLPWLA